MRCCRWKTAVAVGLMFVVSGCDGDPDQEQPVEDDDTERPSLSFEVDEDVEPTISAVGEDRELVTLVDEEGVPFDFVDEELVFMGDGDDFDDFVERWDAEVLSTIDFAELDPDIDVDLLHRVRVDVDLEANGEISDLLREHDPAMFGEFRASSQGALDLFYAAALETLEEGTMVSLNPYFSQTSDGYVDRQLEAAPNGENDLTNGSYSSNPFDWFHYNEGSTQDIGVTEAWRAMALAGLTDPEDPDDRIRLAILDGGFLDYDMPTGARSETYGEPNIAGEYGDEAPWHGVSVAHVAVGNPDSGQGVSGTGGPVSTATMIGVSSDLMSLTESLLDDIEDVTDENPEIINISAGGFVHYAIRAATNLRKNVNATFHVLKEEYDILTVASAGNNGKYLHEIRELPLISDPEKYMFYPCEGDDVMCIGGLATDALDEHSGSNWGHGVALWAPFENYVGFHPRTGDPDNITNEAYAVTGTSFSSPYVAGVAALVRRADPSLSAGEVWDLLMSTSRDFDTTTGETYRYIQADDAVYQALGEEPFQWFSISEPAEATSFVRGADIPVHISLTSGSDVEVEFDGEHQSEWRYTTIDGQDTAELDTGTYEVAATATKGPYEYTRTREIEIINHPPELSVELPLSEDDFSYYEDRDVPLQVSSHVPDLDAGELSDDQITWYMEPTGIEIAQGHVAEIPASELGLGTTTIAVEGDDGIDVTRHEVTVEVVEAPEVPHPQVNIIDPENDDVFHVNDGWDDCDDMCIQVDLDAQAWDADNNELSGAELEWTALRTPTIVDDDNDPDPKYYELTEGTGGEVLIPSDALEMQDYTISLTATDDEGISKTENVEIRSQPVIP